MTHALVLLHVLGACVWTGGHLVLALAVLPRALATRDAGALHAFDERFEKLAVPALVVQVVTGAALAWRARPDLGAWFGFGDAFAACLTLKLAFLLATLALAVDARVRLPRAGLDADGRLRSMALHVTGVTLLAVGLVAAGVGLRLAGAA